jgi:hypothetical protein
MKEAPVSSLVPRALASTPDATGAMANWLRLLQSLRPLVLSDPGLPLPIAGETGVAQGPEVPSQDRGVDGAWAREPGPEMSHAAAEEGPPRSEPRRTSPPSTQGDPPVVASLSPPDQEEHGTRGTRGLGAHGLTDPTGSSPVLLPHDKASSATPPDTPMPEPPLLEDTLSGEHSSQSSAEVPPAADEPPVTEQDLQDQAQATTPTAILLELSSVRSATMLGEHRHAPSDRGSDQEASSIEASREAPDVDDAARVHLPSPPTDAPEAISGSGAGGEALGVVPEGHLPPESVSSPTESPDEHSPAGPPSPVISPEHTQGSREQGPNPEHIGRIKPIPRPNPEHPDHWLPTYVSTEKPPKQLPPNPSAGSGTNALVGGAAPSGMEGEASVTTHDASTGTTPDATVLVTLQSSERPASSSPLELREASPTRMSSILVPPAYSSLTIVTERDTALKSIKPASLSHLTVVTDLGPDASAPPPLPAASSPPTISPMAGSPYAGERPQPIRIFSPDDDARPLRSMSDELPEYASRDHFPVDGPRNVFDTHASEVDSVASSSGTEVSSTGGQQGSGRGGEKRSPLVGMRILEQAVVQLQQQGPTGLASPRERRRTESSDGESLEPMTPTSPKGPGLRPTFPAASRAQQGRAALLHVLYQAR